MIQKIVSCVLENQVIKASKKSNYRMTIRQNRALYLAKELNKTNKRVTSLKHLKLVFLQAADAACLLPGKIKVDQ